MTMPVSFFQAMSRWVTFLLILICCGSSMLACTPLSSEKLPESSSINHTVQVPFGGLTRTAIVHLPNEDSETPMPVVLIFHGGGGAAKGMQRISHFDSIADRGHFIAVYPEGYRRSWADGRGKTPADQAGVDDVGFINALLEQLEQQYQIDRQRIFATGLSNGAFFSQRLGCELSDRIAAIAPVAGTQGTDFAGSCRPEHSVSILEIHGTNDPLVPYQGGVMRGRGGHSTILSAEEVLSNWAAIDGCSSSLATTTITDNVDDGSHLRIGTYRDCDTNVAAELYTVEGGGHTWPGGKQYLPAKLIGKTTRQFDASGTIWEFFEAHPLRASCYRGH